MKIAAFETSDTMTNLASDFKKIESLLIEIDRELNGDQTLIKRNESYLPSISSRMNTLVYGLWSTSSGPTNTQKEQYEICRKNLQNLLPKLELLIIKDIRNIENLLEKAGAPWTPGRIPKFK